MNQPPGLQTDLLKCSRATRQWVLELSTDRIAKLEKEVDRMLSLLGRIKSVVDKRDACAGDRGWIGFECGKAIAASDRSAGGEGE